MTDVERVLFVADTQVNVSECPANSNAGPKVEEYLGEVGLPKGNPWCAAFVAWCGRVALKERWPLLKTGGCQALYQDSERKGLVVTSPRAGDVFLLWFPKLNRFAHTGFVVEAKGGGWVTVEGNTSGGGSREGWIVARRTRVFAAADRFIRWAP